VKYVKFSVFDALLNTLPIKPDIPKLAGPDENGLITLPFLHDVTTTWDWADLDPANPNDAPNLNLTVMGLILATNAETTRGAHAWSQTERSLRALGFTNIVHHYFEDEEHVNHPAMVFGRSTVTVAGKYVVAAVFRGSSSIEDAISDLKAEPGGFHEAGINASNELRSYVKSQGLSRENTILFITGHSYGAATASLVTIMGADIAERDSIFGYSFATPNYIRHGLTGDGMKMFSFDSNEDVVPQVPVGPGLDKTGVCIKYDRLDYKLNDPSRYERFLRLYKYFRENGYDEDEDFLPDEYSGYRHAIKVKNNTPIVRNHMPYTYMALILSEYPDIVVDSYITPLKPKELLLPALEMLVGEAYRLPRTCPGLKKPELSWSTSDESVICVSDKGLLVARGPGVAKLNVTTEDGKQACLDVRVLAD